MGVKPLYIKRIAETFATIGCILLIIYIASDKIAKRPITDIAFWIVVALIALSIILKFVYLFEIKDRKKIITEFLILGAMGLIGVLFYFFG